MSRQLEERFQREVAVSIYDIFAWLEENVEPDQIYNRDKLAEIVQEDVLDWAADHLEVDEVFSEKEILSFIIGYYDPEYVFPTSVLEEWALANGFVKEEEK